MSICSVLMSAISGHGNNLNGIDRLGEITVAIVNTLTNKNMVFTKRYIIKYYMR